MVKVSFKMKMSTVLGKMKEASTPPASEINTSVSPFLVADHGFLSSRNPQIAAVRAIRYIRAYCHVHFVKRTSPINIQEIKMIPADVGFPFADAPSTANALPPSDGSLRLSFSKHMKVRTSVNSGPIRIQYLVGSRYSNNDYSPSKSHSLQNEPMISQIAII